MIRRGGPRYLPFLRDMLHHAYYWRESASVNEELPVYRYVAGWGRPGDRAVIALDDFQRVGAAWYRLFTADEPGYGFVDESTPELTIAVVPNRRGRGHGEELLTALLEQARADGYGAISLSVDRANPSQSLYERYGFRPVAENAHAITMRAALS